MIPGYEKLRGSRYFGKSNILYARFDKHTYTDSRRTQERTELVQPDRRPPQTANGKGQTSTVDGIHQTPYLSSFERTIGATLIIPALPCSSVLLALRLRRELAIEPFTGIVRPPLGPLGLHSGYSIIPLYEMAGRAAPRKVCHALLV
jgi:hypothetical protein